MRRRFAAMLAMPACPIALAAEPAPPLERLGIVDSAAAWPGVRAQSGHSMAAPMVSGVIDAAAALRMGREAR